MKFKIGDSVRVRKDLEIGKEYGMQVVSSSLKEYAGKITIIESVESSAYLLRGCKGWLFTDEMLEPESVELSI